MDAVYDNYLFAEPACGSQFSTPSCLSSPSSGYCSADEGLGSDLCSGVRRSYSGVSLSNAAVNSYVTDGGCGSTGLWQGASASPSSFVLSTRDPCLSEHIFATAFGSHSNAGRAAQQPVRADDSCLSNSYAASLGGESAMTDSLFDQFSGGVFDVEMHMDPGPQALQPPQHAQKQKMNFAASSATAVMSHGLYITTDHGYVTPSFGGVGGSDIGLRDLLRSDDDDDGDLALNSFPLHQQFTHRNNNNNNNNGNGGLLSGFHQQHMAGIGDIYTGDTGDYDLDFVVGAMSRPVQQQRQSLTAAAIASQTGGGAGTGGSGSGSPRLMQLRSVNPARIRNVPVGRLGSFLTNAGHAHGSAAKVRSSSQSAAVTASAAAGGPTRGQKVVGMKTSMSSSRLADVRGGRAAVVAPTHPTYPGLDDHRYTTKTLPPSQQKAQNKSSRPTHGGLTKSSSTSRLGNCGHGTSILEMFLLSSRPVDPNKGSTAALATDGLLGQMHINNNSGTSRNDSREMEEEEGSETLLKMLLTGKIDQNDVNRDRQREISGRSNNVRNKNSGVAMATVQTPVAESNCAATGGDETMKTVSSVDSLLSYGFQLEELDVFNDDDGVWMATTTDVFDEMLISDDLDEILREQSRQDELLLQHYGTEMS